MKKGKGMMKKKAVKAGPKKGGKKISMGGIMPKGKRGSLQKGEY